MKIIVVGCGKIGNSILASLVNEGHDVVAVDVSQSVLTETTNIYDVMCVCGSGTDCEVLAEAGVDKAELVVAVTGSDEFNMLCCFIARRMGAKHTIARLRNPEYSENSRAFLQNELSLSLAINPEAMVAKELYNMLKLPAAAKIDTFSGRNFEMVEFILKPDSKLHGLSLIELRKKYQVNMLVCAVERGENVYIPDGNFVLQSGDRISVTAETQEIVKFLKMIDLAQKKARSVMILGASRTAYYLAKMLIAGGNSVKIIDKDHKRCEEFCKALPKAVVINGDGAQQEVLLEEGLHSVDALVALTGLDEENILLSFFAKMQNVPHVITKINRDEFKATAEAMGIDCFVSPRKTISDRLCSYARALDSTIGSKVETLYKIMEDKAEALEFIIDEDCELIGIPLKDLKLKKNTLVAGISRGRRSIIPSGNDMIMSGDKVVVITSGLRVNDIADIAE